MSTAAVTDVSAGGSVISLPKGGGAVGGLGEQFAPDLFTGTGNLSVPISLPPGRNGLAPGLALTYSTGAGNGPFGLGWGIGQAAVTRKTSRGVPRYADEPADTFTLPGADDLVPMPGATQARVAYRPRVEGAFDRIERVRDAGGDVWHRRGRDGTRHRYGTPRPAGAPEGWRDPAAVVDPARPAAVFAWHLTETRDALGNVIRYEYGHDNGQPRLRAVSYGDYGDPSAPAFLVTVDFDYEPRPDVFGDRRAGFEVRTTQRCRTIRVSTRAADGVTRVAMEYRLTYTSAAFNGASLLTLVEPVGVDGDATEPMPPMAFAYSGFDPVGRRFKPLTGDALPARLVSDPTVALVDLRGVGLPDLVELGAARRFWRNGGALGFEAPRPLDDAPPFVLGQAGVRLLDADGDGRPDLVVNQALASSGYFPMTFAGGWSDRSFQPYRQVPAVDLADPAVKLVDLDGDGLTDVLHSGTTLTAWFNDADPRRAWQRTVVGNGAGPDVDLADPRVRLADMTGDGLADLVLLNSGNIRYWPNLGHGRWGAPVTMRRSPRLPAGHDPRRILLGDLDGDGVADLVYVDQDRVLLWGNQLGEGWTAAPVVVAGTPGAATGDTVQLTDLTGSGMAGLLYERAVDGTGRPHLWFLDLTGGAKPYLLTSTDNHLGATTTVHYRPSTVDYLRDRAAAGTRWRTTLPFPVHVVGSMEVVDAISGGRLSTGFRYRHGYWDGLEREFRGFALVEQTDTDVVAGETHSPPTLTRNWFHPGPVAAAEAGDWTELDLRHEYWPGDAPMLATPAPTAALLASLPRLERRAALRSMRGRVLRTELYALDGDDQQGATRATTGTASGVRIETRGATQTAAGTASGVRVETRDRPYTVTETVSGVRAEGIGIYLPFEAARRATEWERGDEPQTQFRFAGEPDAYGLPTRQITVAVPRGRDPMAPDPSTTQPYLVTLTTSTYARRDDAGHYLVDRTASRTTFEVVNDGTLAVADLVAAVDEQPTRLIGHSRTYFDGAAHTGLPLGEVGEHGLPVRTEVLAFTDEFLDAVHRPPYLPADGEVTWTDEYPQEFRDLLPALAGYRRDDLGYFIQSARHRYDVHDPAHRPRGLKLSTLDALGAESRVEYDEHDLLPVRAIDPAGLVTAAEHDPRLLRPHRVVDCNGNSGSVTYSPAGLVTARFVRGKAGEGDVTTASTEMSYDLLAYARDGVPASVRGARRVEHDGAETIVSVQYSDGFGRPLQTRIQGEDTLFGDPAFGGGVLSADQSAPVGPAVGRTRGPNDPDNVVVSGAKVYDNKGRVVRAFEPFFDTGFDYRAPGAGQTGQSSQTFYDPRGAAVRVVAPDGAEQRIVHGVPADLTDPDTYAPTAWETYTYDANDNAGRTHPEAAAAYRDHWDTPSSVEVDALGRAVRTVARDGDRDLVTTVDVDLEGRPRSVTDPLGRVMFGYVHDLLGRRWRVDGADTGRRLTVPDALGAPVENRDSKGALTLGAFDLLHRAIRVWARDDAAAPATLRQRIEYGDGGTPGQPAGERAAAQAANLLGRPVRQYDEAGLVTTDACDFKGNVLQTTRKVIADAPVLATYDAARKGGWAVPLFTADWRPGAEPALEPGAYVSTTRFDALNRPTAHILPTDAEGRRREISARYDRAGGLASVSLDGTVYVQRLAYDAKGHRSLLVHGNGTMTRYAYDPRSFRLTRLRTEQYSAAGDTYHPKGAVWQDLGYEHDLTGNVLTLRDRTPGSGLPANPAGLAVADPALRAAFAAGDAFDRRFTYDPLYRLRTASGREAAATAPGAMWAAAPRTPDVTRVQAYDEQYDYDAAGNLRRLVHAAAGGFVRDLRLVDGTNRLARVAVGTTGHDYTYDDTGNVTTEGGTRRFGWNHCDRLATFATQTPGAEPSVHAHYLYDAAGVRVKKLVRRQGGAIEVTHYVNDVFEHHRWAGGQNQQIHVMDDKQRVALVRVGPAHPSDGGPAVAVHLTDHLGSGTATVDGTGALTNREEYTPYGETSFGSYTRKRYRYTGTERDEESGLAYHLTRYYSPWLSRWQSVDPIAGWPVVNAYDYCFGNPLCYADPGGAEPDSQMFRTWDTDRSGKLDAREVLDGVGSTTVKAGINFLATAGPSRFTKDGALVREAVLQHAYAAERADEERFQRNAARNVYMWADGSQSTRAERDAYLFRLDFYGGAEIRNGLFFGAAYYHATGDQNGARMINGIFGGLGGAATDANAFRATGAGIAAQGGAPPAIVATPPRPAGPPPLNINPYRVAGGHHIHQSAAYAPAGTSSRSGNPNHNAALAVQQNVPGFTAAQHDESSSLQLNLNRGQNGAVVNRTQIGPVRIQVSGDGTSVGTPSQHFEDVKGFFGLLAGGVPASEAYRATSQSRAQIDSAGLQPVRVPTR
ncbi:SpvB/TcaC N-terminal domain-containing protein [Dactylosporangium sp. NPDC005555]|uniref:SpvB/TcaC N-terminal domain-containing protein n=1 Tax=Dactylosporangium sp. NPDC005555 TaxID=3154889 RepID=UPI0033B7176C